LIIIRKYIRSKCLERKLRASILACFEAKARYPDHEEEQKENSIPQKFWDDLFEDAFLALKNSPEDNLD
jgi:hypothetical protein